MFRAGPNGGEKNRNKKRKAELKSTCVLLVKLKKNRCRDPDTFVFTFRFFSSPRGQRKNEMGAKINKISGMGYPLARVEEEHTAAVGGARRVGRKFR